MRPVIVAPCIFFLAIVTQPAAAQDVSFAGIGPVELGMTVETAERAVKAKFAPVSIPFSDECWITRRSDEQDEAIAYVIQNGRITRIDLDPFHSSKPVAMTTAQGIGIGSTETAIRAAYGQVSVSLAPYYDEESEIEAAKYRAEHGIVASDPLPKYWFRVDSPDHQRGIIFVTQSGKVTSLMTGFKDAVEAMEICR